MVGHVRARTDGDAYIRSSQRGRAVHTVAHQGDALPSGLQFGYLLGFLVGHHLGDDSVGTKGAGLDLTWGVASLSCAPQAASARAAAITAIFIANRRLDFIRFYLVNMSESKGIALQF